MTIPTLTGWNHACTCPSTEAHDSTIIIILQKLINSKIDYSFQWKWYNRAVNVLLLDSTTLTGRLVYISWRIWPNVFINPETTLTFIFTIKAQKWFRTWSEVNESFRHQTMIFEQVLWDVGSKTAITGKIGKIEHLCQIHSHNTAAVISARAVVRGNLY